MDQFLSDVFSFPVIVFTVPLMFFIMFWALTLFGLLDFELFDLSSDSDTGSEEPGTKPNVLEKLGLDGVPLLVALTFIDFYSWLFTYFGKKYFFSLMDESITGAAQGSIVALVALLISIPLAALSVKPLKKMFTTHEAQRKDELTGTICILTTTQVTQSFGQATLEDGSMILNVKSDEPNEISKGERLVLLGYDEELDRYDVVAENEFLSELSKKY